MESIFPILSYIIYSYGGKVDSVKNIIYLIALRSLINYFIIDLSYIRLYCLKSTLNAN